MFVCEFDVYRCVKIKIFDMGMKRIRECYEFLAVSLIICIATTQGLQLTRSLCSGQNQNGSPMPHPEAKSSYIMCVRGSPILMDCPSMQHFDQNRRVCVRSATNQPTNTNPTSNQPSRPYQSY
ncbi:hypothetical protein QAD02_001515, partial [Eretmocerus hayati]